MIISKNYTKADTELMQIVDTLNFLRLGSGMRKCGK